MSKPEDAELLKERAQRCRSLKISIDLLETRARALILEAHELRKLLTRTEEIIAATAVDPLRGDAVAAE